MVLGRGVVVRHRTSSRESPREPRYERAYDDEREREREPRRDAHDAPRRAPPPPPPRYQPRHDAPPPRRDSSRDGARRPASPASQALQRTREQASEAGGGGGGGGAANKFWDGFQWVEPTPGPVPGGDQKIRKMRRLYVGNLPEAIATEQLEQFIEAALLHVRGSQPGGEKNVLSVWIGPDGTYGFVEFASVECATIAIGLSGLQCMGSQLRISRPNTYDGQAGAAEQTTDVGADIAAAVRAAILRPHEGGDA